MESDGKPKVAAAQERVAQQDSPEKSVEGGQRAESGIVRVQESKQDADGENGGKRPHAGHEDLEAIAAKEHFFADGGADQQQGQEQERGPREMFVRGGLDVGSAENHGAKQDDERSADTA